MSVYRWEPIGHLRDISDTTMLLRTDDDRSPDDAYTAQYWHAASRQTWDWMTNAVRPDFRSGSAATADAARRACELAVLYGEVARAP